MMNYKEIAKTKIADNRHVVVSKVEEQEENYTIAQYLEVHEESQSNNGKPLQVYLKGAIHVNGVSNLYSLRNMLNLAISEIEKENEEQQEWD